MTPQNVKNCCKKFNLKKIKAIIVMYHSGYLKMLKILKN